MKTKSKTHRHWMRLALGGIMSVALLIGVAGQGVRAADDDDDKTVDQKLLGGLLKSMGLRRDGQSGIDYGEHSPLVVPPDLKLPSPEKPDIAAKDPAWPKDEDVKRVKAAKTKRVYANPTPEEDSRPLRPDELTPAGEPRRTAREARPVGGPDNHPDGNANPESPAALGVPGLSAMFQKTEEYSTFRTEPVRENLTEPPAGYRTPSPNQPYGVGKRKWESYVIPDKQIPVH